MKAPYSPKPAPGKDGRNTRAHYYAPNVEAPVKALFDAMNEQGVTIARLEERAGISNTPIHAMAKGRTPKLATIEACLNVVGLKLIVVPIDHK